MTVVGCVTEPRSPYLEQAYRLLRSWRWFAGRHAALPFHVVAIERLPAVWRERYEALGAVVHVAARVSQRHGPSNKLRLFELPEAQEAGRVVLLDCDTVVVQPPDALFEAHPFAAKIADKATVSLNTFERLFAAFGVTMPDATFRCTVTGEATIPYFNAGVLALGREALVTLVPEWQRTNARLLDQLHLLGESANFCEQASLSLALAGTRTPVVALGDALNFPAHLAPEPWNAAFANTDPTIIHYHGLVEHDGTLSGSRYPRVNERIVALNRRLLDDDRSRTVHVQTDADRGSLAPLVILGMHRSGTSLAASLLESAGLAIGERLVEGNWSNPRGHFEDIDFVEFEKLALRELGANLDGWVTGTLAAPSDALLAQARALVDYKARAGRPWGWKDPRSVPLLELWHEVVPQARYAIVYRAPWEVVESLFRRGDAAFDADPELAIETWRHYNERLLKLALAAPERCVLCNVDTITADPAGWVAAVAARTGTTLVAPQSAIVEPTLLHGAQTRERAALLARCYPDVIDLYERLERHAYHAVGVVPARVTRVALSADEERRLAVRDWHAAARGQRSGAPAGSAATAITADAATSGWCTCCQADARFVEKGEWLRDEYVCERCGSIPRFRAVNLVLGTCFSGWQHAAIHEYSPVNDFIQRHCSGYTSTHPFSGLAPEASRDVARTEHLEQLPFPDESFDIFVTQDVLEHVFRPDAAVTEILRVLKPGGAHVFTTPKHKRLTASRQRARLDEQQVEHLLATQYHGDPSAADRELVTWDFGDDFEQLLWRWCRAATTTFVCRDRRLGLDGEYLEVFVTRKPVT